MLFNNNSAGAASKQMLIDSGNALYNLITASNAGVSSINGASGI
jgi:hypothetical protein